MAAQYFSGELKRTRRYELGELLGNVSRTSAADDRDAARGKGGGLPAPARAPGRRQVRGSYRKGHDDNGVSGLMLRRIKEELLTFEGKPTVPRAIRRDRAIPLSDPDEAELYERVTAYVRNEMNRADELRSRARAAGATRSVSRSPCCSAAWRRAPRRSCVLWSAATTGWRPAERHARLAA